MFVFWRLRGSTRAHRQSSLCKVGKGGVWSERRARLHGGAGGARQLSDKAVHEHMYKLDSLWIMDKTTLASISPRLHCCRRRYCHSTQSASLSHWGKGMDFALLIHKEHVNKLFVYCNFNFTECATAKLWHQRNCCGVSRIQFSTEANKVYGGEANKATAKRCNMSSYC